MTRIRHDINLLNPLYFDIETVPFFELPDNCKPEPTTRTRVEIKKNWLTHPEGMIKKMSCEFRMNQIVALEACDKDGKFLWDSNNLAEKEMLEAFWEHVPRYGLLSGFAISGFDIRSIVQRSLHHDVIPSKDLSNPGYRKRYPIYDTQIILSKDGKPETGIGLNWYLEVYGLEMKTRKGSEVYGLWEKGMTKEIVEYCRDDVLCEKKLAEHIFPWYPAYEPTKIEN